MYEGPKRRINAVVCNGELAAVFDAMCFLERRRPHELVHDVMREYLRSMAELDEVKQAIRVAERPHLELVEGLSPALRRR